MAVAPVLPPDGAEAAPEATLAQGTGLLGARGAAPICSGPQADLALELAPPSDEPAGTVAGRPQAPAPNTLVLCFRACCEGLQITHY